MSNQATDKNYKQAHSVHNEKKGNPKNEAVVSGVKYEQHNNIEPQKTPVAKYTKVAKQSTKPNPAKVGSVNTSIVNKCRSNDPATAGITKKVGK